MASPAPSAFKHVAIVGAGFSGTLQAINLLRHDGPRVTLIERRGAFARGVAYSTPNPAHLLNVRASNMSALPDDPGHFVRWLAARRGGGATDFASRRDYGDYLAELLELAQARAPHRLTLRRADAIDADLTGDGVTIGCDDGERLAADALVLALGNLPPRDPPGLDGARLGADLYHSDPWGFAFAGGLADDAHVLLIGTGLTMVDAALTVVEQGFGGRITALSRRGLKPHVHGGAGPPVTAASERPRGAGSGAIRTVRARAAAIGWRAAIDELRPHTQAMWLAASRDEQRRFLRHARPWWDVHRHRLAPDIAARLAALEAGGRLRIVAGKLGEVRTDEYGAVVTWRPRGGDAIEQLRVDRIVNCTGPQGDLLRTAEPLLRGLLAAGAIRPDAHGFGIDVDPQAQAIDAAGHADPRLIALGPLTRGTFWEIVAVPDIRRQTWDVARRLSHAQWVGGEGL